jgi:hypothetical protein
VEYSGQSLLNPFYERAISVQKITQTRVNAQVFELPINPVISMKLHYLNV